MATERVRRRCRERIEQLAESSLDSESLRREAIAELKLAIGFERYCVPLADPETEVVYAGVAETDPWAGGHRNPAETGVAERRLVCVFSVDETQRRPSAPGFAPHARACRGIRRRCEVSRRPKRDR
jgi:hypothetical protein